MQTLKRVVKRIVAIGTGVAMLGATMTSAVALDLADYPSPFIVGGVYDAANAIVVGANAAASDTLGAVDIATNFQYESKVCTEGTGAEVTKVSEGFQVTKAGNKFNFGQNISTIDEELGKSDLPTILADGTYSDDEGTNTGSYDYTQKLKFSDNTGLLVYEKNTEASDKAAGDYLRFNKGSTDYAYIYTFDLSTTVTVANAADLESTTLDMLGKTYTIVDATVSSGNVTKLTLIAGDVSQVITQGETVQGLTVIDVDEDETKCIVEYAGVQYTIDKGQIKSMPDGMVVGITDVTAVHETGQSRDTCEVSVGANKIELKDGDKVKINDAEVDKAKANFATGGFDKFNITYVPEDKIFLSAGEELEDPVFGAFKFVFGGIQEATEETKVEVTGDTWILTTLNKDGDTLEIECYQNSTSTGTEGALMLGADKYSNFVVTNNRNLSATEADGTEVTALEGTRFLYDFSDIAHIVEITDIDTDKAQMDFKIINTGQTVKDQDFTHDSESTMTDLLDGKVKLKITNNDSINFSYINDNTDARSIIWTKYGANITFDQFVNASSGAGAGSARPTLANLSCNLTIGEWDTAKEIGTLDPSIVPITVQFTYDSTNDAIEMSTPTGTGVSFTPKVKGDSDYSLDRTAYGTWIEFYNPSGGNGADILTLKYPDEASEGLVYVSPVAAVTTTTKAGETCTVADITPATYIHTEVSDPTAYNLILVGGPCADPLIEQVAGLPKCAEWELAAGEALIQLVTNGNKVAMLVAGTDAIDTRMAAKVISNYGDYTLSGEKVTVTGTISAPKVKVE